VCVRGWWAAVCLIRYCRERGDGAEEMEEEDGRGDVCDHTQAEELDGVQKGCNGERSLDTKRRINLYSYSETV